MSDEKILVIQEGNQMTRQYRVLEDENRRDRLREYACDVRGIVQIYYSGQGIPSWTNSLSQCIYQPSAESRRAYTPAFLGSLIMPSSAEWKVAAVARYSYIS